MRTERLVRLFGPVRGRGETVCSSPTQATNTASDMCWNSPGSLMSRGVPTMRRQSWRMRPASFFSSVIGCVGSAGVRECVTGAAWGAVGPSGAGLWGVAPKEVRKTGERAGQIGSATNPADPGLGDQVSRIGGVRLELAAEGPNVHPDGVVRGRRALPDASDDPIEGEGFAGVPREELEERELGRRESHPPDPPASRACAPGRSRDRGTRSAARRSARSTGGAGRELARAARASRTAWSRSRRHRGRAHAPCRLAIPDGDHEDRHRGAGTDGRDQREAVHHRHREIGEHEIGKASLDHPCAFPP